MKLIFYFYTFRFKVFLTFKISYFINLKSILMIKILLIVVINIISKRVILGNNYLSYEKVDVILKWVKIKLMFFFIFYLI